MKSNRKPFEKRGYYRKSDEPCPDSGISTNHRSIWKKPGKKFSGDPSKMSSDNEFENSLHVQPGWGVYFINKFLHAEMECSGENDSIKIAVYLTSRKQDFPDRTKTNSGM